MPLLDPKSPPKIDERMLVAVDLFAGLGGLSLGLERAGFTICAAIESDELAASAYRENHDGVWLWHMDVREVQPCNILNTLAIEPGRTDLLAGCPPCQGFSRMVSRNGRHSVNDPRNDLVMEFRRFVDELRPKAVMLENVPGLADDRRFDDLCAFLRDEGYHISWRVLNAADFGVAQNRRRLILLASIAGEMHFPHPSDELSTVRELIGEMPEVGSSGDPLHDRKMRHTDRVLEMISKVPHDGGSRLDLGEDQQLTCHTEFDGFKDVYGRMAWDKVAPTITGGCASPSKGRFLHPDRDRVISLREAALLQGFPPGYSVPLTKGRYAAAELIGNAFPPEMAARVSRVLADRLQS